MCQYSIGYPVDINSKYHYLLYITETQQSHNGEQRHPNHYPTEPSQQQNVDQTEQHGN